MGTIYRIVGHGTHDNDHDWSAEYAGDINANRFETREEAEAAIQELLKLDFGDDVIRTENDYRVIEDVE